MLQTDFELQAKRRVAFIHGERHSWDLGYRLILMAMQHLRPNFTYLPVISRPGEEVVPWKGAIGHVQDVWTGGALERAWGRRLARDNTHVFLCGSPQMAEGMIELFARDGFVEGTRQWPGQIHVEKYWQCAGNWKDVIPERAAMDNRLRGLQRGR